MFLLELSTTLAFRPTLHSIGSCIAGAVHWVERLYVSSGTCRLEINTATENNCKMHYQKAIDNVPILIVLLYKQIVRLSTPERSLQNGLQYTTGNRGWLPRTRHLSRLEWRNGIVETHKKRVSHVDGWFYFMFSKRVNGTYVEYTVRQMNLVAATLGSRMNLLFPRKHWAWEKEGIQLSIQFSHACYAITVSLRPPLHQRICTLLDNRTNMHRANKSKVQLSSF